jgi:hypothetical protein
MLPLSVYLEHISLNVKGLNQFQIIAYLLIISLLHII